VETLGHVPASDWHAEICRVASATASSIAGSLIDRLLL
jgi:hypothetical protein